MGVLEEVVKHKEELLIKFLRIIEGKEAKAKVNLDGIEFKIGETAIKLNGLVEFTVVPFEKEKKK